LFEEMAGFFEVKGVAVYDELVEAGVVGDGEDMLDGVTVFAERVDDEIDVDVVHASQYRGNRLVGCKCGQLYGVVAEARFCPGWGSIAGCNRGRIRAGVEG
jgi:hypothetical protein